MSVSYTHLDVYKRQPPDHAKTVLLDDLRNATGADRTATLADSEAQALFHGDRVNELALDLHVVARHDHLGALGKVLSLIHI